MAVDHVTICTPADAASIAPVRHLLVSILSTLALPVAMDVLELAASEILANAVAQERGPITTTLRTSLVGHRIRIEVHNPGCGHPEMRSPDCLDAAGGRGLLIVDTLTAAWGSESSEDDGTTVWFELDPQPV